MITRARVAAAGAALFFSALSCGGPDRAVGSPGGDRPSAVILSPPAETLSVGVVAQFTATARDPQGSPLLSAVPSWSSSNASVAAVTQTGQVTAAAVGQALITATYLGVAGSADVTVVAGPVGNRDFAIAAAQITQGVQDSAGSIPIVLGGNPALVNVFLRAAPAAAASMRVVLRLLDAGGAVVFSDNA
ncbi:MAG: Ig-like domain-containing protein, partial [Gemmatimonadales bacterium]